MTGTTVDWAAVSLRPLAADDVPLLHAWQNDPAVRDQVLGFRGPVQRETTAGWLKNLADHNLRTRAVFGIAYDSGLRGLAQLQDLDWVHRTATVGIYLGDQANRGRGLAFIALSLLLDFAFSGLDLMRVSLTVLADNRPAIRLYERSGFTKEGHLRAAAFLAGQRADVALYAMLRAEWTAQLPNDAHRLIRVPIKDDHPDG